jgi:hypothetical protein
MSRIGILASAGLLAALVLAPAPASAGLLTNAVWIQTEHGFPLTRTFNQATFSGTSTSSSIAVGVTYPFTSTVFGVPKTPNGFLDVAVQITQGGTQSITATLMGASANAAIPGSVIVAGGPLPIHIGMGTRQSMFKIGTATLVAVPLNVGQAGLLTATYAAQVPPFAVVVHTMTVQFYSWTVGSFIFTGLYNSITQLAVPATASAMGSFNLTANGGGMVTLVAPSLVSIDGFYAQRTASFTTLELTFVPEPTSLLLIAAAGVALLLVNRSPSR